MSSQLSASESEPTRRRLSDRQAETVQRLLDAVVDVLHTHGYAGLTVRGVAAQAGVAAATAYTYFASKDHLIAEVFWRRLAALEPFHADRRHSLANRVSDALRQIALVVADEPELAAACTTAMLSDDPDVHQLRDRIGAAVHQRILAALDDSARADVVMALELVYSGAMVQTGMGHLSYEELPDRLADSAALILGGIA
jgi:AcrR family transcriptional regulator